MKIAILHLSDIHFSVNQQLEINNRLRKLEKAIISIDDTDLFVIAITGDIAFSGSESEYTFFKVYLNKFIDEIKKYGREVLCICVPGNHDVCHAEEKNSIVLSTVYDNNQYQKELGSQIKLMRNYNKFAEEYSCAFKDNQLIKSIVIEHDGIKIEFLLVNNAVFSQIKQNYKGLLYLSDADIDCINNVKDADFSICLMHHNFDYYTDSIKHKLKPLISQKSSIIFLGHEHDEEAVETISDKYHTESYMTDAFWDGCNSFASIHIVDTKSQLITDYNFTWVGRNDGFFSCDKKPNRTVKLKRYVNSFLEYNVDYIKKLKEGHKHRDIGDLEAYYVFPRFVEENHSGDEKYSNEIKSKEEFYTILKNNKKVEIVGNSSTGKTSFLQFLFFDKENRSFGKYPLVFSLEDFSSSFPSTIMQNKLRKTFSNDSKDLLLYYLQLNEDEKVLLIDDYDLIEEPILEAFLLKYGSCFKYHVYSVHNSILDFGQVLKNRIINEEMKYYRITSFLSDKREELITKVIKKRFPEKESLIDTITTAFSTKRSILSATPNFIIMFCDFYFGNYGTSVSDTNLYSKVFESSIVELLKRNETSKLNIDKMMTVLQKLAFFIHSNNKNYISREETTSIISNYRTEYLTDIDENSFLDDICSNQILVREGTGFRFSDENVLAFFVAKEICSLDDVDQRNNLIVGTMKNACYSINTSVLLFIIYIQPDTILLKTLIEESSKYIESGHEFSFDDYGTQIQKPNKMERFEVVYDESRHDEILEKEKEERLEKERAIEKTENKKRNRNFYDYKDSNINSVMNQLLRVCNLMYILSKCLPIFEHKIRATEKNKLTDMIYSLPNQIFFAWTTMFESAKESIIEELRKTWVEYRTDDSIFPKDKFEYLLWWESLSLLINLYINSCGIATSENTKDFLLSFNRQTNNGLTLRIQKLLISVQKASTPKYFLEEAHALLKTKDEPANTVIRRIVLNGILHITNVDKKKIQSLASSYFGKSDSKIMKERLKLENKNKKTNE